MPSQVQGLLSAAGQTLQLPIGKTGTGQPPDVSAVFSLTGAFGNATIGLEGVPIGQPITPPAGGGPGGSPSPVSLSSWVPIAEVTVSNGQVISSPVGPLSNLGGVGTGYAYWVSVAIFQMLQIRLISISSGAIQGGIATCGFPASSSLSNPAVTLTNVPLPISLTNDATAQQLLQQLINMIYLTNEMMQKQTLELGRIRLGMQSLSDLPLTEGVTNYDEQITEG